MAFDFKGAIQAGATEDEIRKFLEEKGQGVEADAFFGEKQEESTGGKIGNFISEQMATRSKLIQDIRRTESPLIGIPEIAGQVMGGVADVIASPVVAGLSTLGDIIKPLVPEPVKEKAKEVLTSEPAQDLQGLLSDVFTASGPISKGSETGRRIMTGVSSLAGAVDLLGIGAVAKGVKEPFKKLLTPKEQIIKNAPDIAEDLTKRGYTSTANVFRKSIDKVADTLSDLSDADKNAIARNSIDDVEKFIKQAELSVKDPSRVPSPDNLIGRELVDAIDEISSLKNRIGQAKGMAVRQIATEPLVGIGETLAKNLLNRVETVLGGTINEAGDLVPLAGRALKITGKTDADAITNAYRSLLNLGDSSFQKLDDTINAIEGKLDYEIGLRKTKDTVAESLLKTQMKEATDLMKSVADKLGVPEYGELNSTFSELSRLESVGRKAIGADKLKATSFIKKFRSPDNARALELAEGINKYTGKDIASKSQLSKFAMDLAGDVRQKAGLQLMADVTKIRNQGIVPTIAEKVIETTMGKEIKESIKRKAMSIASPQIRNKAIGLIQKEKVLRSFEGRFIDKLIDMEIPIKNARGKAIIKELKSFKDLTRVITKQEAIEMLSKLDELSNPSIVYKVMSKLPQKFSTKTLRDRLGMEAIADELGFGSATRSQRVSGMVDMVMKKANKK